MAGSINLANVALGFDASALTKGVDLSAGELRKLGTVIKASESNIDKYADAMKLLDIAQQKGAVTADRLAAAQDHLAKKYGIETYAMIEARQEAEKLNKQKKDDDALDKLRMQNIQRGIELRKQVMTAEERHAAALRTHSNDLKRGIIDQETYNRLIEQSVQKNGLAAKSVLQVADAHKKLAAVPKPTVLPPQQNQIAGDIKSVLAQYAGMAAAFAGVKKSLSLAATAETNKIALEVLTGSTAKAQMLYEGFIELDRSSPLSRADFSRSAQTLIGYGFAAESTLPALKALSEVSVGNADRFQSLSLAFGQVTANGRLMGQEVLQMVNAGFNPLQEISRTTGRSMIELKKAMEDGAISASMVEDAFKSATSEGGRFYEMNEKLKNSAAGQFAKMSSDVEMMATEIGTKLLPAMKALMDLMNSGADATGKGGALARFAETFSVGLEGIIAIGSDAFMNLDSSYKGTKFSDLQERLGEDELRKQMEKEHVRMPTFEEKERIKDIIAKRAAKEREELEAIAAKEKKIADDKAAAAKMESDRQKKAQQEADAAFQKLIKDSETLKQKARSPFAEYILEFERLQDMFNEGFIDEATFEKQTADALEKANKNARTDKKGPDKNGIDLAIAPTLAAGSVEAYKFMNDQKNDEMEMALKQTELAEINNQIAQQQLDAIKEIQPIGRAR
jgi:tape measure domain-containing protein